MKRIYLIGLLLLSLTFFACNDYLDVRSDKELLDTEIFSGYSGVRMLVNGVYKEIATVDLYGRNMSWGLVSVLGQNYLANTSADLPRGLFEAASYQWENISVRALTDRIWSKSYNVIASCNNIIQEVEKKDSSFFELGEIEKNMVLGEMYGIRAMLHFDILRLFCPAPITGQEGEMPYVTTYPEHQPKHKKSSEVLKDIIRDMEISKGLLAEIDTVFCSWNKTLTGRLKSVSTPSNRPPNSFVSYRGHRMNYFAATALLARICMYAQEKEKAEMYAWHAYDFHKRNSVWGIDWTPANNQGQNNNVDNVFTKRHSELFWALYNKSNYDNWESTNTSTRYFLIKNTTQLFNGDFDDFRLIGWYDRDGSQRYLTWIRPTGTSVTATNVINDQGPLIPMIRFSEMYHILIELMIEQGRMDKAIELFTTLRLKRGAKAAIDQNISKENLMEKLVLDMVKENLTEGQSFFIFKRLNRNIFNGPSNIVMSPQRWTIPLPDSETSYQF